MFVTAIIAAAGRGERFGVGLKQLLPIDGRTLLDRSVAAFLGHPAVDELIVALPEELVAEPPACLRGASKPVHIVAGGARRQDSVANAFQAVAAASEVVVVHDAARPFASEDLIARTIAAAAESGAALAAVQARDTVKRVWKGSAPAGGSAPAEPGSGPAKGGYYIVRETIPRESIFLAQTPQAFRRNVLRDALAVGARGIEGTDEAALAERAGHTVRIVEGEASNIKITTPDDVPMAEVIARAGAGGTAAMRVGNGYDLHRLVDGRPLVLGGVTIPFERGLAGYSDADAVCHAITDAVLGAASFGDIGQHFPDTDPQWDGASSIELLRRVAGMIRELGWEVCSVDATVIAERPKLAPYVDAMRANVASALDVPRDRISIKGKTNEGVGELGRGEAIAVHAVALLRAASPVSDSPKPAPQAASGAGGEAPAPE